MNAPVTPNPPAFLQGRRGGVLAFALGGALLVSSKTLVPRLIAAYTGGVESYFQLLALATLAPAILLALAYGWRRPSSYGLAAAVSLAGVGYVASLALASMIARIGQNPTSIYGLVLVTAYLLGQGFYASLLAQGLDRLGRKYSVEEKAAATGLAMALAAGVPQLLTGSGAYAVLAIAASAYAVGTITYLAYSSWGPLASSLFYGLFNALIVAGPVGIGGPLLLASVIIVVGLAVAWYTVSGILEALEGEGGLHEAVERGLTRREALALAALVIVAGLLVYAWSVGIMFWKPYAIVTGSMEPTLNRGDLVILEKPRDIQVGDIITYRYKGVPVTHRVIDVVGTVVGETPDGYYITKGDANAQPDPYKVRPDDIIGEVRYRLPLLGWPVILVNWTPQVRIVLLIGITLVLGLLVFRGLIHGEGKEEEAGLPGGPREDLDHDDEGRGQEE